MNSLLTSPRSNDKRLPLEKSVILHAPASNSDHQRVSANHTGSECPVNLIGSDQLDSQSLGGTHHCIGTTYTIVNMVFRHLHAQCGIYGGSLTSYQLTSAQNGLVEKFQCVFDLFENIHQRCMSASGATAPMMFAKGRMLSSLLLACSQRSGTRVFSYEVNRLGADWLNLFYDALSESVRQHVTPDAEARLTSAYTEASGRLGQKLSIKKLLLEKTVQNVLRECVLPFDAPRISDSIVIQLNDEVNEYIAKKSGNMGAHISKVSSDQLRKFLTLFPREVYIVLKEVVATETKNPTRPSDPAA